MTAGRSMTQPPHPTRRALTMVEVSVSILVVGVTVVAALNTVGAARVGLQRTGDRSRGTMLAQQLMTEILQQHYEDPNYGPGSFGLGGDEVGDGSRSLWEDVDDYAGWQASPPEDKDGNVLPGFNGWARAVEVVWVNPADLSQTVGYDTRVKRIVVTVTRNGLVVATMTALRTGYNG